MLPNKIIVKRKIENFSYLLFFAANFLVFLNPGAFWDDWSIYNAEKKVVLSQFYGNGALVFGYLHIFLKNIWDSPVCYHIFSFIFQFFSLYLLFRILEKFKLKKKELVFFLISILIYSVFPVYDAKITMIVLPYTLCLTLFIAAFLLLLKYNEGGKQIKFRILSLMLFFLSFFTNSLLFFYIIPIFLSLFLPFWKMLFGPAKIKEYKNFIMKIFKRVLAYLDFFILPFLFWTIKSVYFKPSQQYASLGYNEVKLESLLKIPYRIVVFLYISLADMLPFIREAFTYVELWIIFALACWFLYTKLAKINLNFTISWKYLLWGFITLLLGAFPYLMVNKYPTYLDYLSRHQLLLGFGFSLLFCAAVFILKSQFFKRIILSIGLAAFLVMSIFLQFSYFKGYMKQVVFQHYFFSNSYFPRQSPESILLNDYTENFTQKGNPTKFYAFAGMLKKRYSNENLLLARPEDWKGYLRLDLFPKIAPYYFQYNLTNYSFITPKLNLEVRYAQKKPMFPIFSYYYDFLSGHEERWDAYFKFNLKPIKAGNNL